jgi:starch synthase
MISMRYGCVPIARATGGLADTIKHVSRKIDDGTGFLFEKPYPSVFATILKRALRIYQDKKSWSQIQLNGMKIDFSWEKSAQKYIDIYHSMINNQ